MKIQIRDADTAGGYVMAPEGGAMSAGILGQPELQGAGNGSHIIDLPPTTFDDDSHLRRLADGSVVGEEHIGSRALLRLVRLEDSPEDEISRVRIGYVLGAVSVKQYSQIESLAGQN